MFEKDIVEINLSKRRQMRETVRNPNKRDPYILKRVPNVNTEKRFFPPDREFARLPSDWISAHVDSTQILAVSYVIRYVGYS